MRVYILIGLGIIGVLLVVMILLYAAIILKVRATNRKVYRYREEKNLKEENVLIIYQPSKHKTTNKIVDNIKQTLEDTRYGYFIHTLNEVVEDYSSYKKVIFVAPVYFGEIHLEFLRKILHCKINNLIMIYNGLNKESNKEDEFVKKNIRRYSKIKLYTEDIERVKEFIKKEVK